MENVVKIMPAESNADIFIVDEAPMTDVFLRATILGTIIFGENKFNVFPYDLNSYYRFYTDQHYDDWSTGI